MENILEKLDLKPPATSTFKSNASAATVRDLKSKCEELRKILSPNKVLDIEVSLAEKLIYRSTNRLRLDVGFRYFRNIKRFSKKLKALGFQSMLSNFISCLPEATFGTSFYLPSRQMLQHLLHQLIALVVILEKIVYYSEKSGYLFLERIRSGHSWSTASIFLGTASRINYLCSRLSWKCCIQYNGIATALETLKLSGSSWTPENFNFPKKLNEALEIENPSKLNKNKPEEISKIFNLLENVGEIDGEDDEEIIQFYDGPSQLQADIDSCEKLEDVKPSLIAEEDLGEVVTPNNEVTLITVQRKKNKRKRNTSEANEVIDVENDNAPAKNLQPPKKPKVENRMTGTMEEKIDSINSLSSLTKFIYQEIDDPDNAAYVSAKRQVSGIVKTLKKKKPSEVTARNLVTRAKSLLKDSLL